MIRAMPRQPGFSLLELVAVLLLVGILVAVAAPRLGADGGLRELGFAETLLGDLRLAQRRARADRCPVRVTISSSGYVVEQRAALCSGAFDRPVARTGEAGSSLAGAPPTGMTLAASPAVFYFEESGATVASLGGAAVDVAITTGARQIDVVGATGYAAF